MLPRPKQINLIRFLPFNKLVSRHNFAFTLGDEVHMILTRFDGIILVDDFGLRRFEDCHHPFDNILNNFDVLRFIFQARLQKLPGNTILLHCLIEYLNAA